MKTLRILAIVLAAAFSLSTAHGQEKEKIKLSPGMLLRVWPNVNKDMQKAGNEPASAGVVDLGAEFSIRRTSSIQPLTPSYQSPVAASEWSGYLRIEHENTYVITISKSQSHYNNSALYVYIKGAKILDFPYAKGIYDEVKSKTVKLSAGYHPISFYMVNSGQASFQVKVRPASELDSEPMKVSDFYFRKK